MYNKIHIYGMVLEYCMKDMDHLKMQKRHLQVYLKKIQILKKVMKFISDLVLCISSNVNMIIHWK